MSSIVKVDTIQENTSANGITVDGLNIKDSKLVTADSVVTNNITDANITTDKILDDNVTYAKIQNVSATDRILGRDSSGAGVIEEITPANLRTMINVADGANAYTHPNHSGEVTSTADGATVIADNIVDEANLKVSNSPTNGYFLSAQSGNTGGLTWAAASSGGYWSEVASGTATGDTNINFTNLPANKVLRLIVSGAIANPDIYFSNDNGSSYRTTNEYAHLGFMWRTDESYATSNWYKDSTANGLLYINGWFGQGTYGSGLDITFYNMSSSSRASTSFAWSTGSHQRSNPETTLGFQSASLNTRETNNAMRLDTRSGDTNISYILLSGDES